MEVGRWGVGVGGCVFAEGSAILLILLSVSEVGEGQIFMFIIYFMNLYFFLKS